MIEASARPDGATAGPRAGSEILSFEGAGDGCHEFEGRLLGRLGRFEVRLAASSQEVRLAQELRYAIFHQERGLETASAAGSTGRDEDRFDHHCDHLLLIDPDAGRTARQRLIGTYRLLPQHKADAAGGFYGQSEFDVAALVSRHRGRRFLELGRSCVQSRYRGLRTVELLWHAIWVYVLEHRIDVLFGCASLPGPCPQALAAPLAFLRAQALAPEEWQTAPLGAHAHRLACFGSPVDERMARHLPPLVRGYLRLGGMVSDHAVVDHEFHTTDLLLVLPLERIAPRYVAHYGAAAERFA